MTLNQIHQGDCLELMKELESDSIDMLLCDLPYGVTSRNEWDIVIPLDLMWVQFKRVCKTNSAIVLTCQHPFTSALVHSNLKSFKYEWIWSKAPTGFLSSKHRPLQSHENVLVFCYGKLNYNPQGLKPFGKMSGGSNNQSKNYESSKPKGITEFTNYPRSIIAFGPDRPILHPTQKPVALFEYLIRTYTKTDQLVLDPCIGSGTTAVACLNTQRNFIGIDLSLEYVQLANKRVDEWWD